MTVDEFAARLHSAADAVVSAQDELTDIDSKFGDADHGITMTKISNTISEAVKASKGSSIKAMLSAAADDVMMLNGGSAVPLWNTWLTGMSEGAPDSMEISAAEMKSMFSNALSEITSISKAKVGDKTMMDALIPASEAIAAYPGSDCSEMLGAAAEAAERGAEKSRDFVSKFGRARSYGEQTIGTPDAGAVSMKCFFEGLARA